MGLINRDELLSIVDEISVKEISDVMPNNILCKVLIDPWEKKIILSNDIRSVLGSSGTETMDYNQYVLLIPEHDSGRTNFMTKFENDISDLLTDFKSMSKISHFLITNNGEELTVVLRLKVISIDKKRYVYGTMINETPTFSDSGFAQIYGEDMDIYVMTYDKFYDICYLSRNFIDTFILRSGIVENFSRKYARHAVPEESEKLNSIFNKIIADELENFYSGEIIHLLTPAKGDIYFKIEGISHSGLDGTRAKNSRYFTMVMTDATDFVNGEELHNTIIESSSAVTFYADINKNRINFSENIRDLIPNARLEIDDDFVEEISESIVNDDQKRFRNTIYRAINEVGSKFTLEIRVLNPQGKVLWVAVRGKSVEDKTNRTTALVGTAFDLTQMNEVKENVERRAASNEITGLPSRGKLIHDIDKLVRNKDILSCGLMLTDINGFHSFNDRYGRVAGNEILISLADLLKNKMPAGSSIYHIGTDVFGILWPGAGHNDLEVFLSDLQDEFAKPLSTRQGDFFINVGLSGADYPMCSSADELMTNAEIALHKVKQNKKLKYAVYLPVDMNELKERFDFELQITQSIRNNMENFQLYYQPLVDARTGEVKGAEALLRWQASNGEFLNPEKVVAAFESTDQMNEVGDWILNEAMSQCAQWIQKGAPSDFFIHINATADDLIKKDYAKTVERLLENQGLKPENILIEITETSLMKNMSLCRKNLYELHEYSIKTALDDFGSGYSSFNYLKELPVDEIKIDKTFVDDMETNEFNRSFINAMIMLAHSIDKKVVVEGVESQSQADIIKEMGADLFQGYLYGKPMSVFAFWNQFFS